jgi:hypothetical protein
MPGGKGAPPGCHHGRFGHAAKAYFGAILPSNKVQGFCGPPPTLSFSFFSLVWFPWSSKLLLMGKRVGELPPPPWVVFVAQQSWHFVSFGIH